ncbi:hypothetical protein QE152_g25093 [Popillia japonica]|uniref:Uncharacterized protein n=1 Tax=Popillia japonica TaxID=7064 RepID=A0AAW1K205_POPJA
MLNQRISAERLAELKEEVSIELGLTTAPEEQQILSFESEEAAVATTEESDDTTKQFTTSDTMHTPSIIAKIDRIWGQKIRNDPEITIEKLHLLIYVGAYTAIRVHGQHIVEASDEGCNQRKVPDALAWQRRLEGKIQELRKKNEGCNQRKVPDALAWQRRLEGKIQELRKKIGQITQAQYNAQALRTIPEVLEYLRQKLSALAKSQYNAQALRTIPEVLEYLRQKLSALAKRLKRYLKAKTRRDHNRLFRQKQHLFYKRIDSSKNKNDAQEGEYPTAEVMADFWQGVWGERADHKESLGIAASNKPYQLRVIFTNPFTVRHANIIGLGIAASNKPYQLRVIFTNPFTVRHISLFSFKTSHDKSMRYIAISYLSVFESKLRILNTLRQINEIHCNILPVRIRVQIAYPEYLSPREQPLKAADPRPKPYTRID